MEKLSTLEHANIIETRMFLYNILKYAFYVEPNIELIKLFSEDDFLMNLPFKEEDCLISEGIYDLIEYFKKNDVLETNNFKCLHWDYTKMFVGPGSLPAPPWGSAYITEDRLLFQESTLDARKSYLKYNLIVKNYLQEPDDHIGSELDFMYRLCEFAVKNIDKPNKLIEILEDQRSFLNEHIGKWVFEFSDDIIEYSDTLFYKGIAKILKGFIRIDKVIVSDLIKTLN
ncbi:TorD/DmsD family molecular chaperone [Tepidibacter mesophilus]|uniref:TorD/DmsD family molecular chaperone n=1 Tax=Tepidibacter mesophilus TaxID=655607 RepID=UPI000C0786A0|nr:molecular chaperone TorD family protein [Tepidibacter mesophilus]